MIPQPVSSIDDVISVLEKIILEAERNNDTLGYFAVLYLKVTVKVKEGINNNYFDDCEKMERLDVLFAKRYIDAWFAWKQNLPLTLAWKKTFIISKERGLLVFQHLLLGMNAHINLDLGIAVAEVSTRENIHLSKNDFIKINLILSSLVEEVQHSLSYIWPMLKKLLLLTNKVDDFLIDFSMKIARDGAWKFATHIILYKETTWQELIDDRDNKVSEKSLLITHPGKWIQFLFWIIRLGERGSVADKINKIRMQKINALPLTGQAPLKNVNI
jgi:hypothetical protein